MVLYEYRKHNADAFARFYYCFFVFWPAISYVLLVSYYHGI